MVPTGEHLLRLTTETSCMTPQYFPPSEGSREQDEMPYLVKVRSMYLDAVVDRGWCDTLLLAGSFDELSHFLCDPLVVMQGPDSDDQNETSDQPYVAGRAVLGWIN